jgi:hypothetical protein
MSDENKSSAQNPLSEWLRLQMDLQAKLADETLRYLRRLQVAAAPVTPGTVLVPEAGTQLTAKASSGGSFEVTLEVENCQRVHAVAAPVLDPLVSLSGTTWYPETDFTPAFMLISPDETVKFVVRVSVPASLPAGTYTGALSLLGMRQRTFLLSVIVGNPTAQETASADGADKSKKEAAKRGGGNKRAKLTKRGNPPKKKP